MTNSFYALKKITPSKTIIIPGNLAVKSAGGDSPFTGKDAGDPYNAMANAYSKLTGEAQFGGAMTWDLALDHDNSYTFAKTIKPVLGSNSDQIEPQMNSESVSFIN